MGKRKQQFHLEPDRGLLNDPNGLAYYKGNYYVFFQWNRFEKNHGYKEWGIFISPDIVHWKFQRSAILPDQMYDFCGVYSGSGLVIEDKLYLFYTGNAKIDGARKSSQCIAVTGDGRKFLKLGCAVKTPQEYTEHFRDPKVWKTDRNGFYMLIGGQRRCGKGALALCRSTDGIDWKYIGMPAVSGCYEMIECPDLFRLGGRDVLLYNPQSRDNAKDISLNSFTVMKLIDFDEQNGRFSDTDLDHDFVRMDYGFDFYAPQTFEDGSGRRILYAWMSRMTEEEESAFAEGEANIHCLTLPRELKLMNGKLYQKPVDELEELKGSAVPTYSRNGDSTVICPEKRTYFLSIDRLNSNRDIRIRINTSDECEEEASLYWNADRHTLVFKRKSWVTGKMEPRECRVEYFRKAEIWCDRSSIEIFINDGEKVMSSRIEPETEFPETVLEGLLGNEKISAKNINHCILENGIRE